MIPHISARRICYDFHKLRCFSCGALLPLGIRVDYQLVCSSCGQVHDCAPVGVVRPAGIPTHKTVSRLLPSGAVSRRRVPLSAADSQLDLFGGAQ